MICRSCGKETTRGRRFCDDKCSATWYRDHCPRGIVKSIRRREGGGVSVVLGFVGDEAERALHFQLRQPVLLGVVTETE